MFLAGLKVHHKAWISQAMFSVEESLGSWQQLYITTEKGGLTRMEMKEARQEHCIGPMHRDRPRILQP